VRRCASRERGYGRHDDDGEELDGSAELNSHWRWRGLNVVVATPSSCQARRCALTQIKPGRPSE
jgi:hypothetical protein